MTPNLQLPYIAAAQAQKHVTHNEALRALDAIVQLSVLAEAAAPPAATPSDGDRYLVAASATGAFAGHVGKIAAFQDGAWSFLTPRAGWLAWLEADSALRVFNGSAWAAVAAGGGSPAPAAPAANALINGNLDVWQRGPGPFTAFGYTADRFRDTFVGSGSSTTREDFTPGQTDVPGNPRHFLRTVATSVAGAGNYVAFSQKVEDVRTFAGGQVTVSFYAKADAAKQVAVSLHQSFGVGGSAPVHLHVAKFDLTTSWTRHHATITLPGLAGKTIGAGDDHYLQLAVYVDAGSDHDAYTGSLGQQSGTFDFAGFRLEAGASPSDIEPERYGDVLARCQAVLLPLRAGR